MSEKVLPVFGIRKELTTQVLHPETEHGIWLYVENGHLSLFGCMEHW